MAAVARSVDTRRRLLEAALEVFVIRHVDDLPTAAVAAALGIAPGSVKRHLFRAIRTLRDALGDHR